MIQLVVAATHQRAEAWIANNPRECLDQYGRHRKPRIISSAESASMMRGLLLFRDEIAVLSDVDPEVLSLVEQLLMRPGEYLARRQPVTISKEAEKKLRANLLTLRRKLDQKGDS